MRCHMQTTILKPSQKLKAKSQKQSPKAKAKSQKPKANSQKPKAKAKSQKLQNVTNSMQIRDSRSKMQQIARRTGPDWKTKKNNHFDPHSYQQHTEGNVGLFIFHTNILHPASRIFPITGNCNINLPHCSMQKVLVCGDDFQQNMMMSTDVHHISNVRAMWWSSSSAHPYQRPTGTSRPPQAQLAPAVLTSWYWVCFLPLIDTCWSFP